MNDTVVKIHPSVVLDGESNPSTVSLLQRALDKALTGEIVSVAVVPVYRDGGTSHEVSLASGNGEITKLIGALFRAAHGLSTN